MKVWLVMRRSAQRGRERERAIAPRPQQLVFSIASSVFQVHNRHNRSQKIIKDHNRTWHFSSFLVFRRIFYRAKSIDKPLGLVILTRWIFHVESCCEHCQASLTGCEFWSLVMARLGHTWTRIAVEFWSSLSGPHPRLVPLKYGQACLPT